MFQGHDAQALLVDTGLALLAPVFTFNLWIAVYFHKKPLIVAETLLWLGMTPHAAYAFLELKHLVLADGVADNVNLASLLVFGSISVWGLISAIVCIIATAKLLDKSVGIVSIALPAFWMGFAATLGELDVTTFHLLFNPELVVEKIIVLLSSASWFTFAILFSTFLTLISVVAFKCFNALRK